MKNVFLAAALFLAALAPAQAEELLETYIAELGPDDHYNSRGQRLTAAWQIIRQDRANFHRFGIRDPLDEGDTFFGSLQNRAIAERMLRQGRISRSLSRRIVNESVVVRVEIWGYGSTGTALHVFVY